MKTLVTSTQFLLVGSQEWGSLLMYTLPLFINTLWPFTNRSTVGRNPHIYPSNFIPQQRFVDRESQTHIWQIESFSRPIKADVTPYLPKHSTVPVLPPPGSDCRLHKTFPCPLHQGCCGMNHAITAGCPCTHVCSDPLLVALHLKRNRKRLM